MRVAFLGSFLVDYTLAVARSMTGHSQVLLLVDDRFLARDVSIDDQVHFEASGGLIRKFRQARIWNRWFSVVKVIWILLGFKPDAVVAHEHLHPHLGWMMRGIDLFAPLLLIVHDPKPHIGRDAEFAAANRKGSEVQRGLASAFVVHGQYCADTLKKELPEGDERKIYSIVMGSNFEPTQPAPLKNNKRLLMFGHIEMYKGLELLLDAAKILQDRGVQFHLRMAGRRPELDRLKKDFEALKSYSIESRFISLEDALVEFSEADVFFSPYIEVTQSGVVAVAFASGRPVIATEVGGLADFVHSGVNGILVQPASAEHFTDAIQEFLSNSDLAAHLAQGALKSGRTVHSWSAISQNLFLAVSEMAVNH